MESFDGLWKDEKGRILVRLYTTKTFIRQGDSKEDRKLMVKCTLRVIQGHNIEEDAVHDLTLVSVLPKRHTVIMLTSLEKRSWSHYWKMEGSIALVAEGIVLENARESWIGMNGGDTFEKP